MAEKKSIVENALLDIEKVQKALNANTKEILRSVAREEIDGLVKESLKDNDLYEEETIEDEADETEEDETGDESEVEIGDESDDESDEESGEGSDDESDEESGEEIYGDESDETDIQIPDEVDSSDQEIGMDADALGGVEDLTSASDDDIIAIYKKLSGDDEIEIVGDEIHLNISEPGEYIVKKGALGGDEDEMGEMGEMGGLEDEGEEMTYEVEIDGEDEEMPEAPSEDETDENQVYESEEDEEDEEVVKEEDEENEDVVEEKIKSGVGMSVGSHSNLPDIKTKGPGVKESVSSKSVIAEAEIKYKKLLSEAKQLKNENEEFRQALKKFRSMLVETVVFNSNLSYVTKLFMEHSTTKDEKKKIIQRFDEEVTNLKESKKLYKTIVNELTSRKPMNESVENKITKEVNTSSSKLLNETTAYVDPSTQRIKDLISRVENKDKY
jgi:hypothetical protein